ncbi:MAG: arsenite efflux transporter metallochaperone ArsD [Levilactobacillus sp.]|jgi:hypothetical protein|uniref:Arsenical resistance operon transcriptional repressor ArsD n=1 Tax=Levilactobacillus suantsaiihabitans TaxID=2487722 RepID=A0A4Z0J7Z3_9LACO|nr:MULTISPECIES: arsenite efflux transporter metallochaperone ArsD [Levilactobacillus]MCI1554320.1 arsenite efflux transporter metallochaperone ArsD [Levilactobacillus sp.]MCI1598571.1 arsenite efflux transporter metallochaperone ArsD [Levilactobacillus sp.]MCI1606813.1 arsenite efflux transporter metallochaperone ArsD [Levilactobacillus sp.]TGD18376.1 arsenical resistance operon transcriptional repressor ArsD [Levilactobacillus suantsaiihabitans]
MRKIQVYEEALCCPTGVCGPVVRQDLLRMTAVQKEVNASKDVRVIRYNLAQNPGAFAHQAVVQELLATRGMACLPITMVGDEVVKSGEYPSVAEFSDYARLQLKQS